MTLWTVAHQANRPWDFSGKNTRVGCHFLLQGNLLHPGIEPGSPALQADSLATELLVFSESESHLVLLDSLWPHGLYSPWNSPGQNTGVDSLSLLQGIFPTQGLNPGLPHCRLILYQLSHKGSLLVFRVASYCTYA